MRISRVIGNNAVLCIDSRGREVVAVGKGIGFGAREDADLDLSQVRRTFYGVDARYLPLIEDIDSDLFELASHVVDAARAVLSYDLSPNLAFALADHLSFAITRMNEHLEVAMPLSMDVIHTYPVEYQIGKNALKMMRSEMGIALPEQEAVGVALTLVNAAISQNDRSVGKSKEAEHVLDQVTALVERQMHIVVDRESFDYMRFATHVLYLINRIRSNAIIESENSTLYRRMKQEFSEVSDCADRISDLLKRTWGRGLTEEERLYLILHINRVCAKVRMG